MLTENYCRAALVAEDVLCPPGTERPCGKEGTARGKHVGEEKNYPESQWFSAWLDSRITWRAFKTFWRLDPTLGDGNLFGVEWVPASAHFTPRPR